MEVQNEICERCKAKNSLISDYESGELVCNNCGLVYEERMIVDEYEGRTFQNDDEDHQIKRVGPPSKPEYGNELGINLIIRENGKTKVIKSYSKHDKVQRNFIKIQKLLSSVDISQDLIENVKEYYGKFSKQNMQGRNINHIIIALYYYACRKQNMAKTIKQVTDVFKCIFPKLTERIVKKVFNSIKDQIVESYDENEHADAEKNYIQTFIGGNIQKYKHKMLAFQIVENINKIGLLEGKNPKTIAGLSLLLSYKLLKDNLDDEKEFYSNFSNKTTIKNSYAQIKDFLGIIIPQDYNNIILDDLLQ